MTTIGFIQASHDIAMLSPRYTHPPPLVPPFLLVLNLLQPPYSPPFTYMYITKKYVGERYVGWVVYSTLLCNHP